MSLNRAAAAMPDVVRAGKMRGIDPRAIGAIKRPDSFGPVSELRWLEIALLRIDPRYQREITVKGLRNVRGICESFSWAKFAPVVVAPVEGGLFAIVDGQHRTTAAARLGIASVPCMIIQADPGEQARAFRSINAQTTRVSQQHLHRAAVASGEPDALHVAALCDAADVRVMAYPVAFQNMKAGQTTAIEALYKLSRERRGLALATLRAIRAQSVDGTNIFRSVIIDALRLILSEREAWWRDETGFVEALSQVDLDQEWRDASAMKARTPGLSTVDAIYRRLTMRLVPLMQPSAAEERA